MKGPCMCLGTNRLDVVWRTGWNTDVENALRKKALPIDNYDLYVPVELKKNYNKDAKPEHFGEKKAPLKSSKHLFFFSHSKNLEVQSTEYVGAWNAGF